MKIIATIAALAATSTAASAGPAFETREEAMADLARTIARCESEGEIKFAFQLERRGTHVGEPVWLTDGRPSGDFNLRSYAEGVMGGPLPEGFSNFLRCAVGAPITQADLAAAVEAASE